MTAADVRVRVTNEVPPLDVSHSFIGGATTAVVGPNGAGKTTLLRLIAGLLRADATTIEIGAEVVQDGPSMVPAHRRGVAMLSQDARLFPHLSVGDNVAFAPSAQRLPRAEVRARVAHWLEVCDVRELAGRKPAQLSGGQAQRVAIARALAAQPRVLLLDEPFRALDVDVAGRVRVLLRDLLADRTQTTIMVTHDVVDVVTLADQAVVLDGGRVVDAGAALDILHRPANAFTANLAGLNLVSGRWTGTAVVGTDLTVVGFAAGPVDRDGSATAVFSPAAVVVSTSEPAASSVRNIFAATVAQVVPRGDRILLDASLGEQSLSAELTREALAQLMIAVGDQVWLAVKASAVRVY